MKTNKMRWFQRCLKMMTDGRTGRTIDVNHTGTECIRRFGGIYAYCQYFIDRKW